MKANIALCCLLLGASLCRTSAVTIAPNYTFANVYQDSAGVLYAGSGSGRSDVTTSFKEDILTAMTMWTGAIPCDWSLTINFNLANLGSGTVANAAINSFDTDGHGVTATINFNTNSLFNYFIDLTPNENSEFSLQTSTMALGGTNVNNRRLGNASVAASSNRWDLLTLSLHEIEHSLGISSGSTNFLNRVGATGLSGDPLRSLTISNSFSGLPSDFSIPFVPDSAHIAGTGSNSNFNYTVVAEPGWQRGQRALPTAIDIYAVAAVNNCDDFNLSPVQVPEPTVLLTGITGAAVLLMRRAARRRRPAAP